MHQGEPGGEPSNDVEPVQDVAGVTEMLVDGCLVGLRPVGDDHSDAAAPAWPLFDEKPGQRSSVAMLAQTARREHVELIWYGRDHKIQGRNSYGSCKYSGLVS